MQLAALLYSRLECPAPQRVSLAALLNKEWAASTSATSGITDYSSKRRKSKRVRSRSKP